MAYFVNIIAYFELWKFDLWILKVEPTFEVWTLNCWLHLMILQLFGIEYDIMMLCFISWLMLFVRLLEFVDGKYYMLKFEGLCCW